MQLLFARYVHCLPRDHAEARSIHEYCQIDEAIHRWLECEKAQCDLGIIVVEQWVEKYWNKFLRARWIEHLEGKYFWIELDRGDFGLLQSDIRNCHELFDPIVERLRAGDENLNILLWILESGLPTEPAKQILELLDVNGTRIPHRLEELCHIQSA